MFYYCDAKHSDILRGPLMLIVTCFIIIYVILTLVILYKPCNIASKSQDEYANLYQ